MKGIPITGSTLLFFIKTTMILTRRNRGDITRYRYLDASLFVKKQPAISNLTENMVNAINLYDYIVSYLSESSCCSEYTGDVISTPEIRLPDYLFSAYPHKRSSTNNHNKAVDLWACVNQVVRNECDLDFSMSAPRYTIDYIKSLYLPANFNVTEYDKSPWTSDLKKTKTRTISLKEVITEYTTVASICNLPTMDFSLSDVVTVDSLDAEYDGLTFRAYGLTNDDPGVLFQNTPPDGYYMSIQLGTDPIIDLYSGNFIPAGTSITAGDITALDAIGVENVANEYNWFTFDKNTLSEGALAQDVTIYIRPVQEGKIPGLIETYTFPTNGTR